MRYNTTHNPNPYPYKPSDMNCRNVIVAGYNSGVQALPQYLPQIQQAFQTLNTDNKHSLKVVSP